MSVYAEKLSNRLRLYFKRILAVIVIGGGLVGLNSVLSIASSLNGLAEYVLCILVGLAYGLAIAGGIALAEGRQVGIQMVLWFQVIQVPILGSTLLSYNLSSPVRFAVELQDYRHFETVWFVGSKWFVSFLSSPLERVIGLNLFPIGIIALMFLTGMVKKDKTIQRTA